MRHQPIYVWRGVCVCVCVKGRRKGEVRMILRARRWRGKRYFYCGESLRNAIYRMESGTRSTRGGGGEPTSSIPPNPAGARVNMLSRKPTNHSGAPVCECVCVRVCVCEIPVCRSAGSRWSTFCPTDNKCRKHSWT